MEKHVSLKQTYIFLLAFVNTFVLRVDKIKMERRKKFEYYSLKNQKAATPPKIYLFLMPLA
jgi:hypothetical protein